MQIGARVRIVIALAAVSLVVSPRVDATETVVFSKSTFYDNAIAGGTGGVVLTPTVASSISFPDEFGPSTSQNLITGGDGAKSYNWNAYKTANATTMTVNSTNAGKLTIAVNTTNSGISATTFTVPCAYQDLTGDFDVSTLITTDANQDYEGSGIFVASTSDWNLHVYFVNYSGGAGQQFAARSSNGVTEVAVGSDGTTWMNYLRVTRIDNVITIYRKANSGDSWTTHGSVTRNDIGATVHVGLYAQSGNAFGNFTAQFDYFHDPNASTGSTLKFGPMENIDTIESDPMKFGLRASADGAGSVTAQLSGTDNALFAMAPDNNGVPGAWGAYGDNLAISSLNSTATIFWIKSKADSSDAVGSDHTATLTFSGTGIVSASYALQRKVIPPLEVFGTAGNYYLGYDFGAGVTWGHNGGSPGDIDVVVAGGSTYANVVYDNTSTSGDDTTLNKELAAGLNLTTIAHRVKSGTYKITHTFTSTSDRWIKTQKLMKGTNSSNTSTVTAYQTATTASADAEAFQAVAIHHTNGAAVGLAAGNGYENDWCIYGFDYTDNTAWYNTRIAYKQALYAMISYGTLANLSTSDYTVRLQANVARDLSYVLSMDFPTTQSELNEQLYSSYFDAYNTNSSVSRNNVEKMLWATSHQLRRIKRHILVEGSKVFWQLVSRFYSPLLNAGDAVFNMLGQGDPDAVLPFLETLHSLGPPDGIAATANLQASAANIMDNTYALYIPVFELYAKNFFAYSPSAAAQTRFIAIADAYADAILNAKMIPDTATREAHIASDIYAGSEVEGFGDFEQALYFTQSTTQVFRWSSDNIGTGTSTRVGTDNSNDPRGGSYQAKLHSANGTDIGRLKLMKIAVPASKVVTITAYVNVPGTFSAGGFRFNVFELDSSLAQVANTQSAYTAHTTGFEQKSHVVTLNASTTYLVIGIEASGGAGTVYVDDVQSTIASPGYPGYFWTLSIMPPQVLGNTISPNLFGMVWAQVNLKCLKELLGAGWTANHQSALDAVDATYPAAYWTDINHIKIKDDPWHHRRSGWLNSWALFGHYVWSIISRGEKIFSDGQIASVYANYPSDNVGYTYGNIAFKGWVVHTDGTGISGDELTEMWLSDNQNPAGFYVNAGNWLWAADAFFHSSAMWAGVASAETNKAKRFQIEVSHDYASHEYITLKTDHGNYQTSETTGFGYGANVVMLSEDPPLLPSRRKRYLFFIYN